MDTVSLKKTIFKMDAITECPIDVNDTFAEKPLILLYGRTGRNLCSVIFGAYISGMQYSISIYPYGKTEEQSGQTWIYLNIKNSYNHKFSVDFSISVESTNFHVKRKQFSKNIDEWEGFGVYLCEIDDLFDDDKKFIVNREIEIKMDGIVKVEQEYENNWKFCRNGDFLCLALWDQEEIKDFTFSVKGKKITAHKCVLAARSSVFKKMFEFGMIESKESKMEITDFEFIIVETAIKLCYHHSLITVITFKEQLQLLHFFDKYDIDSLKDELEDHLITEISEFNVVQLINVSILSNALKLQLKCSEFLQKCQKNAKPVCEFDLLDKDFAFCFLKNSFNKF